MAVRPTEGSVAQACRVCGGEVNPHGECVVCGTKQSEAPVRAEDRGAAAWLKGESSGGMGSWLSGGAGGDSRDDALRKWLAGEDNAFQDWIGVPTASGPAKVARGTTDRLSDDKLKDLRSKALEVDGMRAELDAMRATLNRELPNFRQGKFDPVKYIEETASLSKQLQTEIAKRKELEQEIEHIKKGSIAVIKYVKTQQLKASASSPDVKKRLDAEAKAREGLEAQLAELRSVNDQLKKQLESGLAKLKPDQRDLKKREVELGEREAALRAKEERIATGPSEGGAPSEELKRRLEEELREKEQEYLEKEETFKKRIIALEEQVGRFKIEEKVRAEAQAFEGKPKGEMSSALSKKEQEVLQKEKSLLLREQTLQRMQDELQVKEDEIKKVKEPLAYKEEELLRREEDLLYREKLIQAERRKVEEAKAQGGSADEMDLKARLEELKSQINVKEEEVRTKEKYLQQKMEELRMREQGLIEEDIGAREQELQIEVKQQKVKTGIPRLDDLMFGGIPFGINASVYGPAYVGKEVLVNLFMAEGLKKGVPVLWVLTDKGPADIREEMSFVLPSYEEYEKLGLVRYVDAYSKSMGADASDPNTTYIDDPTDHQSILKAVETTAMEWKKKHPTYRLGFRSVSTLIAYLDPTTTFKFLQPFIGRRKRDKAVAFYVIEKGMHEEQEIQMLGSLMDGSIEFKVEQLKSFLSIKGICDVQSRGWIRYTYTKSSVSVGSFSLDHIK
ncbi:MAG TPA: ATPase domain-containing protein [Thermoplasmata archaeon]|jgi:KaiC/GvpD/RAD55 family RecA-like ATPase|nr:ATPase domain-containing protein [Thermoplasmata archaeon]